VKAGTLNPKHCHVFRVKADCRQFFNIIAKSTHQQLAPVVIENDESAAFRDLFPKCGHANRSKIKELDETDFASDPLWSKNETDHINMLPVGPFKLYTVQVAGRRERVLVATGYVADRDVGTIGDKIATIDHSEAFALVSRHPCRPQVLAFAGYPSANVGEGREQEVILIGGVAYLLSLTQFEVGRTAVEVRLDRLGSMNLPHAKSEHIQFFTQ
jgi:hypothetical protein